MDQPDEMERSETRDSETRGTASRRGKLNGRTAKGLIATSLAIAVLGLLAPAAWAHDATATVSCKKVKYAFVDFPAVPGNTVRESVYLNGVKEVADTFTFDGSSGRNQVRIAVSGSASIEAKARWNTNGAKGSYEVTQEVTGCVIV